MDLTLTAVTALVVKEGITFLYKQAGEFLTAWRRRKRDPAARPPVPIDPPPSVTIGDAKPIASPENDEMVEHLQELKDLAEAVKDGDVDPGSDHGRTVAAALRDTLELLLQAPISFEGETPRSLDVTAVKVTAQRIDGNVAGVRAKLADLPDATSISDVQVETGDVDDGDVTGVDLT